MIYGCGKSDEAIVAGKPANKAERSPAELVERRAEAKGNVGQQRTLWVTGAGPHTHHRHRDGSVRTRGGSRMRESCTYGSVRGAGSNRRPYRDRSETPQQPLSTARPWRGFRCAQPILLSLLQDIPPRPYLAVQPVRFAQDRPGLNDGPVRHVIEELQDVGEVPRCAKLRSDLGCERFSADVAIGAQRHV